VCKVVRTRGDCDVALIGACVAFAFEISLPGSTTGRDV
jgi:hypothetical protein